VYLLSETIYPFARVAKAINMMNKRNNPAMIVTGTDSAWVYPDACDYYPDAPYDYSSVSKHQNTCQRTERKP
jgi:hypothetical protein